MLSPCKQAALSAQTELDCMQNRVDINQIASMMLGPTASVFYDESFHFSTPTVSSMSYNPNAFGNSLSFDTLYGSFASGSNTISPHSTSTWSSGFCCPRALPPSVQHAVWTEFNNQSPHAIGASAAAYGMPFYPHTADLSFQASSSGYHDASTFPTHNNGWNSSLPLSTTACGQFLPIPPVSLLPPGAYTLPSFSQNTSEALHGWNITDTASLKHKERDGLDLGSIVDNGAKRARLFGPEQADAISRPWPVQEADFGASLSRLEHSVPGGVQRTQPYELSGGMGGSVAQTSSLADENRRLREEIEMLKGMVGSLEGSGSDIVF
ncbi:hypothetical protein V5O48_015867 [Marasmius crinis-equi]|uniref:Uncharacterized protein n=1 Tax=Marasmius crinis-equi TaxID=585013 RepID=A0ABR3ET99_9AGAR